MRCWADEYHQPGVAEEYQGVAGEWQGCGRGVAGVWQGWRRVAGCGVGFVTNEIPSRGEGEGRRTLQP